MEKSEYKMRTIKFRGQVYRQQSLGVWMVILQRWQVLH